MDNEFIAPEPEELTESGLAATDDLKERWETLRSMSADELLEHVTDASTGEPETWREASGIWLAQQLGYSRIFRREEALALEPLWSLLDPAEFEAVPEEARRVVEWLAHSTPANRTALPPMAAVAAIALWRNGNSEKTREEARRLLERRPLPDDMPWLYDLVDAFASIDATHGAERPGLFELAELQLSSDFRDITAYICALLFSHRYAPWSGGTSEAALIRGCDRAAEEHLHEVEPWLHLLADAATTGALRFTWLEKPVAAALRLSVGDAERHESLRAYHERRLYSADRSRLADLYEHLLKDYGGSDEEAHRRAERRLLEEVHTILEHNPRRAQHLLELLAIRQHAAKPWMVGSDDKRLEHALEAIEEKETLDESERLLVELYIQNYDISPAAVRFVRQVSDRIDWNVSATTSVEELDLYLTVGDYERAFEHLTCKFDGVELNHADKNAAARVTHFVERRVSPGHTTRLLRKLFTPVDWLGSSIADNALLGETVDHGLKMFEERVQKEDMRQTVVEAYAEAGYPVGDFESIAELNANEIDAVLEKRRRQRILLGAVAGGLSGGLSPLGWAFVSLADVPIILALSADICSRFCWYYGFDPRRHPNLPLEILAVALGGSRPAALEPLLLRQNLTTYAVRSSLMVGAVARGGILQLAGRALGGIAQKTAAGQLSSAIPELLRRTITRNLQRRAATNASSKVFPIAGALLGASLNATLLYDICEAAQIVLIDHFLERKYPNWLRQVSPDELPAPGTSELDTG